MRLDRELTLRIFEPLHRGDPDRLPILMYHSISDDPESGVGPYYRITTSPARFPEQMQWLSDSGFTGVSLEEALVAQNNSRNRIRPAAITFDDGFRDFYTEAWPVLQRHRFTATMYLPTAFISTAKNSLFDRDRLTWDEVRDLYEQGVRFGSHTVNHPKLHQSSWNRIEKELMESKIQIEQELGESISSFAYPFAFPQEDGSFTKQLTETVRACGYESCVTTVIGCADPGDDPFRLKRLPVNDCDDQPLFAAKLAGAYDWMARPQLLVRQAKSWTSWTKRRRD